MDEIDDELAATVRARVGTSVCGGRYAIENVLGIGGMAAVYAGMHRNGRLVAMKFLHPEYSRRSDIRKRFVREGQAANAVHHPGVVAVIDDDVTEDGSAFLVMERLDGKSLEQLWEELGRRVPTRAILAIGRELCDVLVVAHAAGIFHRDIKPENLFLTREGKLKVLDFGLAHLRDATRPKDTHTGMVFGTPAFMPPEQASGQTSKIDARTDIWAVGATLFTLLSGELVHRGETAQHFVMLAATEAARSLREPLPHAHPLLVEIVDRALARDKESRWQTAAEMRDGIAGVMELLLGEADIAIPTLAELAAMALPRKPAPPKEKTSSDEPTQVKLLAIGADTEETLSDATRVDTMPSELDSELEQTQRKAPRPPANASNTPTEQTTPDEMPTQLRVIPESSRQRVDDTPAMQKRTSWSDLRQAIEESKEAKHRSSSRVETHQDETALLHQQHTAVLSPSMRGIAVPARSATPRINDRQSHPALLPLPRKRNTATTRVRAEPSSLVRYGPIVGVAMVLGLWPLAYFLGRSWSVSAPAPAPSTTITQSSPRISAAPILTAATAMASASARPREAAVPAVSASRQESSVPAIVPPPLPSNPYGANPCAPPFRIDSAGIKRWKLECLHDASRE